MENKIDKEKLIIVGSILSSIILVILLGVLFLGSKDKNIPTYKIIFNSDGGSKIEEQIIKKGNKVLKPTDPIKEGYTFIDWSYNGVTYDFKTKVTKDITLVARWFKVNEAVETFTIKFNSDGGTTISNQVIEKGKVVVKPTDPTKEGYAFKGWVLNKEFYDFSKTIENDVELVAMWEKINKEESTIKNDKKTTTKQVIKPAETTKPATTIKKEETTTKPKQQYTITFNSTGGSAVSTQTITEGGKVSKPSNPTRSGYNFVAWTLNGNNYDFNSLVNSNITLVAKWQQKSYTIKISAVDDYSPTRTLTVYEDGVKIVPNEIRYTNGTYLCSGSNANVNYKVVAGQASFKVVLSDGTSVTATVN